jgi:hypothetical protein
MARFSRDCGDSRTMISVLPLNKRKGEERKAANITLRQNLSFSLATLNNL